MKLAILLPLSSMLATMSAAEPEVELSYAIVCLGDEDALYGRVTTHSDHLVVEEARPLTGWQDRMYLAYVAAKGGPIQAGRRSTEPIVVREPLAVYQCSEVAVDAISELPAPRLTQSADLAGLWTQLLYADQPLQSNYLPIVYGGAYNVREKFDKALAHCAENSLPLVLDIERVQHGDKRHMWIDTERNTPEQVDADIDYMTKKLARAQSLGVLTSLWDRPSHNGLAHAWKDGEDELKATHARRLVEGHSLIARQDFLTIQLYIPSNHEGKSWAIDQAIARGEWFLDQFPGKTCIIYVSPQYGGVGNDLPAEELERLVRYFLQRDIPVCIWGGLKKTWNPDGAMEQTLLRLTADYPRE